MTATPDDVKDTHLKRLRRIEGQIRGLQRMIGGDSPCIDVLTQLSAATHALESFALVLLEQRLQHCVSTARAGGGTDVSGEIQEATDAIARLVRLYRPT